MAIPLPADGKGSTLTFAGLVANLVSIDGPSFTRDQIDTTHMGSVDTKQSIPSKLFEAGEITAEVEFDPSAMPPIQGAIGTLAILWGSTVPSTWTWASAYLVSFKTGAHIGARMTATVGIKLNGKPVIS